MTRTRWIGFGLWIACAVFILAAIGVGLAVSQDVLAKPVCVGLAVGLALAAEASFWAGGAVLGFSFFAKRGGWVRRLLRRDAPAQSPNT